MARWRLTQPHYLNVPGTEWEYKETNRVSGKQATKRFPVPLYLDPEDVSEQTPPNSGMIVVTDKANRAFPHDIVFVGPPTPDMDPLDEEAEAISEAESKKWVHPIDSLPGNYSASLLTAFEAQLAELMSKQPVRTQLPQPSAGVSKEDFDALQSQVAQLMARNAELEAAQPKTIRR